MTKVNLLNYQTSNNLAEVKAVYKTKVKPSDRPKITCSDDAVELLKNCFNEDTVDYTEEFIVILLNKANKVLGWVKISAGGLDATTADARVIFALALQTGAQQIILSHNHPSGEIIPSEKDTTITKKLVKAGTFLNIPIVDHIILADGKHYSFADEGII